MPQSSPDDEHLLLARSFLGSFGVHSGVDRSALPLAASYWASVSPNFFLSKKKRILISTSKYFRVKQSDTF